MVNQLAREGYIKAIRGKNGGIKLGRPAQKINVGEVIRSLEGNLDGIDCGSPACYLVRVCRLKSALKEAMDAFISVMEEYTLADLIANEDELMVIFTDRESKLES